MEISASLMNKLLGFVIRSRHEERNVPTEDMIYNYPGAKYWLEIVRKGERRGYLIPSCQITATKKTLTAEELEELERLIKPNNPAQK
ncbi:MAG: hypothetical protein WCP91_01965 [Candidatus Berkelbacteria bacterium]